MMDPASSFDPADHADALVEAVARAGSCTLGYYRSRDLEQWQKDDASPVTAADLASHEVLFEALMRIAPEVPVLSEEGEIPDGDTRSRWTRCWVVDPLDGTREFLDGNDEFTVNVALVEAGRPVFGLVGVPCREEVFVGDVRRGRAWVHRSSGGEDASIEAVRTRPCPGSPVVTASRSHRSPPLEEFMEGVRRQFPDATLLPAGSALKLVEVARGAADGYPRLGPCSEWDIAAGEAVLVAAGGVLRAWSGEPLGYNKRDSLLNPEFWCAGDPQGALARYFAAEGRRFTAS